jgi:phosphopantothenoylcysteine decarboxylase/phosphopantothenate--cysteine ligase
MGFALATAARDRGAQVLLVCGPVSIPSPSGVDRIDVRSAIDMKQANDNALPHTDGEIITAAVADYRPARVTDAKIKKSSDTLTLELVKNPDILASLGAARQGKRPVLIGFAMETHDVVAHARKKLVSKKVDLVVANEAAVGFGRDDTQATLVSQRGDDPLPPTTKLALAHRILDRVCELLKPPTKTSSRRAPRPRAPTPARRRKGR